MQYGRRVQRLQISYLTNSFLETSKFTAKRYNELIKKYKGNKEDMKRKVIYIDELMLDVLAFHLDGLFVRDLFF